LINQPGFSRLNEKPLLVLYLYQAYTTSLDKVDKLFKVTMRRQDIAPELQQYLVHPNEYPHVWALLAPPTPRRMGINPRHEVVLAAAYGALGRLREALVRIPNADMVTRTLVRREAVMSSQIEGTRSELSALLTYEATQDPGGLPTDVRVTERYVNALDVGLGRLRTHGVGALNLELIHQLHACLMQDEADRIPVGAYRSGQVWVGVGRIEDASFVPTPAAQIGAAMAEFEQNALAYAPREEEMIELSLIARLAIVHAQFETIHPYADGNGRTGRLLLPLLMAAQGLPPMYVSGTLLARKAEYYTALASVQLMGEWGPWVELLTDAVLESCTEAIRIAEDLLRLAQRWEASLKGVRSDSAVRRLPRFLIGYPVLSVQQAARELGVSIQAANTALNRLHKDGVLELVDEQRQWGRVFRAREVLERVDQLPGGGKVLR
jgi:Fic family protein